MRLLETGLSEELSWRRSSSPSPQSMRPPPGQGRRTAGYRGARLPVQDHPGRKVFMLQYRTNAGERRKPALGQYGELTVDQARTWRRSGWPRCARVATPARPRTLPARRRP
ncbi:integrase arm-type DNA-binding domain-containing protein [Pseudothauera nasutitermitis]